MKKNILFYSSREINPNMGGIERVTDTLAHYLNKEGYGIVYLVLERTGGADYTCDFPQYFIERKNTREQVCNIVRRHNITICINQDGGGGAGVMGLLPQEVRIITVLHDSKYAMYKRLTLGWLRKFRWKYLTTMGLRKVFKVSDKIVLFFDEFVNEIRFFVRNAPSEKFTIIPNFNSYQEVGEYPKENRIVWVGRHAEWHKRTSDMLKIWKKLENRFPEWQLDVLGDGPDGDKIRDLHKFLGLNRCNLCGTKAPRSYYEKASIFCMTSSFESFGMVLTESMQYGCVPMAYDSYTAVRHIIHDDNDGFLVKPFDIDEYAEKLANLMADVDLRTRMAAAAKESVKRYDAEKIMPLWIKLIEELS